MKACHNKYRIWVKAIAMAVVCLFLVNDIMWAQPTNSSPSNSTLAIQSIFNPIINAVGIQHQKQIELELSGIIAMTLRGLKRNSGNPNAYKSFLNINSALDKRCSNPRHEGFIDRTLEVVGNPTILDDNPEGHIIIRIKTVTNPETQKHFKIIFKGDKLDDMFDGSKIEVAQEQLGDFIIDTGPSISTPREAADLTYIEHFLEAFRNELRGAFTDLGMPYTTNGHPVYMTKAEDVEKVFLKLRDKDQPDFWKQPFLMLDQDSAILIFKNGPNHIKYGSNPIAYRIKLNDPLPDTNSKELREALFIEQGEYLEKFRKDELLYLAMRCPAHAPVLRWPHFQAVTSMRLNFDEYPQDVQGAIDDLLNIHEKVSGKYFRDYQNETLTAREYSREKKLLRQDVTDKMRECLKNTALGLKEGADILARKEAELIKLSQHCDDEKRERIERWLDDYHESYEKIYGLWAFANGEIPEWSKKHTIAEVIDLARDEAGGYMKFPVECPEELKDIEVLGNYRLLSFSLHNAINGAGKANPDKMPTVSIKIDSDYIYFTISDEGNGILPENLWKISDGDFTTKSGETGHAVTRRVVLEQHGGNVEFDTLTAAQAMDNAELERRRAAGKRTVVGTTVTIAWPKNPAKQISKEIERPVISDTHSDNAPQVYAVHVTTASEAPLLCKYGYYGKIDDLAGNFSIFNNISDISRPDSVVRVWVQAIKDEGKVPVIIVFKAPAKMFNNKWKAQELGNIASLAPSTKVVSAPTVLLDEIKKRNIEQSGLTHYHETLYECLIMDAALGKLGCIETKNIDVEESLRQNAILVGNGSLDTTIADLFKGAVQEKRISPEDILISNELILLNHATPNLKGYPVDEVIDLSLIPKEDLGENMKTWAYIIALNNKYGLDVNYIFKSEDEAYTTDAKKALFEKMKEIKGLEIEKAKARVIDTCRPDALQIHIMKKEDLEKLKDIPEGVLPVALSEGTTLEGTPLRDFMAASAIGLVQAACKRMQIEKNPHLLEIIEQEMLPRMQHIYQRLFPDKDIKEIVTKETILNMIDDNPIVRKSLALALALPPIIRTAIQYLKDYHDRIHLLQQAA